MSVNSEELKHALGSRGQTTPRAALHNMQVVASNQWPQLAPLILALHFTSNDAIETMGVNAQGEVLYSPTYLASISDTDMVACIKHEALHLFLDYFVRRNERDNFRWNVAHDLEISAYVQPKQCLVPQTFGLPPNKIAEFYYDHLPIKSDEGKPNCGCSQHQLPTDAQGAISEGVWRAIVQSADELIKHGSFYGTDSSAMRRALEIAAPGHGNSTLRRLQGSMLVAGLTDVSYERPNRRMQWQRSIILPAAVHREPRVLCILDVSGSMIGERLKRGTSALLGAVKSVGAALDVVAWDTHPITTHNVRSSRDLRNLRASGGGTDMRAAILSAPLRGNFDTVLVITDCETPWPTPAELRRVPPVYVLNVGDGGAPPAYLKEIRP